MHWVLLTRRVGPQIWKPSKRGGHAECKDVEVRKRTGKSAPRICKKLRLNVLRRTLHINHQHKRRIATSWSRPEGATAVRRVRGARGELGVLPASSHCAPSYPIAVRSHQTPSSSRWTTMSTRPSSATARYASAPLPPSELPCRPAPSVRPSLSFLQLVAINIHLRPARSTSAPRPAPCASPVGNPKCGRAPSLALVSGLCLR